MPITKNDNAANLAVVAKFFGGSLAQFRKEWNELTADDKAQICNGIGDGTFTY